MKYSRGKIEFTVHYTRQITALILSKYIGLYALKGVDQIWISENSAFLGDFCYCFCNGKKSEGSYLSFCVTNEF